MKVKLTETQLKRVIINEQIKVAGPFNKFMLGVGDAAKRDTLYIMKYDKDMCYQNKNLFDGKGLYQGDLFPPDESGKCTQHQTKLPKNKFYIHHGDNMKNYEHTDDEHAIATNNQQGFNSAEEAKKSVSQLINPDGKKGRQVAKGTYTGDGGAKGVGKTISKYDKEGNLKSIKYKFQGKGKAGRHIKRKGKKYTNL